MLLHPGGAGVDSRALDPTLDGLARVFRCYTPEQRAHGRTPDADGPVSYELMAGDTIAFIERVIGQPGLLVEKPALCNLLMTEFLTKGPVQTFAPIRRAAPQPQHH